MLPNFANFLSSNGITLSLLMGAVGLVVAVYLIKIVIPEIVHHATQNTENLRKQQVDMHVIAIQEQYLMM